MTTDNQHPWCGIEFISGAASAQSTIDYVDVRNAAIGVDNYPGSTLSNSSFQDDIRGVEWDGLSEHTVVMQHDNVMSTEGFANTGIFGGGGDLQITDLHLSGGYVWNTNGRLELRDSVVDRGNVTATDLIIENSTIYGMENGAGEAVAASYGSLTVTGSRIEGSHRGVWIQNPLSRASVTTSTIVGNDVGLDLSPQPNMHINRNSIYGNKTNVYVEGGNPTATIDATSNWWGTTDAVSIGRTIRDCGSDLNLPCVLFQPYLDAPESSAPSALPTSTSVPMPTSISFSPTATSTFVPTRTVTPIPTATIEPSAAIVLTHTPTPTITPLPTATTTSTLSPTPRTSPEIRLASNSVGTGGQMTVAGAGFGPTDSVTVSSKVSLTSGETTQLHATTVAFSNGTFIAQLSIPADAAAGAYAVVAVGYPSGATASTVLSVGAVPTNSTNTPAPTATSSVVPTLTPVPAIAIDKVLILHNTKSGWQDTQSTRYAETLHFTVLYHVVNAGKVRPSGTLMVTKDGVQVAAPKLVAQTTNGHAAFGWQGKLTGGRAIGKLYAHFRVTAGQLWSKRDRRFVVRKR